ncbi:Na+/glucose cotransporter, partial [bacterium]|nr:Na+/glucose cotransporter [bacterium]
ISTFGSALYSLTTVFTMDIYVKKYAPNATQKSIIKTGRLVVLVGSLLSIIVTLGIDSIKGLNLFDIFQSILGFIAPPMSVVFLFGVLWNKTTTRAANIILTVGTFISMGTGVLYLWVFPNGTYSWPHFLLLSFYIFVLLAVLIFGISIADKKGQKDHRALLKIAAEAKPDKQVKVFWEILSLVMIALYLIFNGH